MSSRFSYTSSFTKIIIIVEFLLVSYLLYSLTKNVYNSYKVDKYIETFEQENALIESENRKKSEDYLYFTSEEYIDKIAKQNLGLVNQGEEVIVLAPEASGAVGDGDGQGEAAALSKKARMSNPRQWWEFFFSE